MKINFSNDSVNINDISAVSSTARSRAAKESSAASESEAARISTPNYDKVELSSHRMAESDEDFAAKAAKQVLSQVESGVSSDRVSQLKEQVSSGTYHIDADYVASKILGYSE